MKNNLPVLRTCLIDPVPELFLAASYLDEAVSEHLLGSHARAAELIRMADIRVDWLDTIQKNKAVNEVGLFGNQNTVCQPTAQKWRHTVERLKARLWGVVPPIFGNGGHPVPCGLHLCCIAQDRLG